MKFTFKEKVKIKSGLYKGREAYVIDSVLGIMYACSSRDCVGEFFANTFWFWQLERNSDKQ